MPQADEPDARVDEDAVARGMQALDKSRARGTLPPDEAYRLAVEEIRAVRRARRHHT